ncbi:hypothetical protein EYF80_039523 [Liparis tanakae]|uniref:Uncharacterized protein n=1 Tax=Liparis tanakae TaxID=230148 RepID=A0A4Z2G9V9_9TELE|nr:hypothetical protein EYF80_039523 [Liparis tanakae]
MAKRTTFQLCVPKAGRHCAPSARRRQGPLIFVTRSAQKRLTRTVERSLRFLMKSALSKRPSPSPSSLLLLLLQCLLTPEDDLPSLLAVDLVDSKDALLANSFSREHFCTLGLRLSLSKLE